MALFKAIQGLIHVPITFFEAFDIGLGTVTWNIEVFIKIVDKIFQNMDSIILWHAVQTLLSMESRKFWGNVRQKREDSPE